MKKKLLLGIVLAIVPGAGIAYGSYLVYRCLRKKPRTTEEFIQSLKDELKNDNNKT